MGLFGSGGHFTMEPPFRDLCRSVLQLQTEVRVLSGSTDHFDTPL
jgi:hypothetical protein